MKKLLLLIVIPAFLGLGAPVVQASDFGVHTVQEGDYLYKLAKRYDVPFQSLLEANSNIQNVDLIYPNEKITVPLMGTQLSIEQELFNLTNNYREERGLPAFRYDWQLMRIARAKAIDMAEFSYAEHESPTYGYADNMLDIFGLEYEEIGENIGHTLESPQLALKAFSYNEANFISEEFTHLGVGYAENQYTNYWVQLFIKKPAK